MQLADVREALARRGVAMVCPACGIPTGEAAIRVDLGTPSVGIACGHCGHLRLFDEGTLDAPHP